MDEVLIFANPIAGRGRGREIARRIYERAARAGLRCRMLADSPHLIAAEDLPGERPPRAVVVVGGDGTLRGVCQRLLDAAPDRPPPPLLIVPLGTANLMGRHLGIRWDDSIVDQQVLAAIQRGRGRELDAARANGRLFLLMAGVGIDAQIVHLLESMRSGPIDLASYVLPTALAIQSYRHRRITATVDGRTLFADATAVAFVGNAPEYGTGFPILPHARTDDGLLDVCIIPVGKPTDVVTLFLHAAAGEHLQVEGVVYTQGKDIRIDSNEPLPVQLDGDAAGFTPLHVDLLPFRLPFIVP